MTAETKLDTQLKTHLGTQLDKATLDITTQQSSAENLLSNLEFKVHTFAAQLPCSFTQL